MLFLVDESLSPRLTIKIRELGYNAKSVREVGLKGFNDMIILEWAIKNNAVIITGDLDFGELWHLYYRGRIGIIVLRTKLYNLSSHFTIIKNLHDNNILTEKKILTSLVIATISKYRIRS